MAKSELKKQTKQAIKVKKKKWVTILSPAILGERAIGESYLEETELAIGRTVKVNLMQVSGDVKSQSSDVKFEITGTKDNVLTTKIIGYYFSGSTLKRFIRRHMTRVDDSLVIMTSDNVKVRIKPFVLTRSKVSRAVEYALRNLMKQELITMINKTPYEALFSAVIKYQLQKELREKLSKIYPIKNLEIKSLEEEANAKLSEMPIKKTGKKPEAEEEEIEEIEEVSEEPEAEEEIDEEPVPEELLEEKEE